MAQKKLADLIGLKNTELETWDRIRKDLSDPIADAFKLWAEVDGLNAFARTYGIGPENRRLAIGKILSGPILANPNVLCLKLRALKEITTNPPEADALFDSTLYQYGHEWAKVCLLLVEEAAKIADAALADAVAIEEKFFSDAGLPRQETSLAAGASRVVNRLTEARAHYHRLVNLPGHAKPYMPDPGYIPELFSGALAKREVELAAIGAELAAKSQTLPA